MEADPKDKAMIRERHLWIVAYGERPLYEKSVLDALEQQLARHLPGWAAGIVVKKSESQRQGVKLGSDVSLFSAVHQVSPPRFGHAHAVVTGSSEAIKVYLDSSRSTLPPEGNSLAVEIVGLERLEGKHLAEWGRTFFGALMQTLPVRYARANGREEFDAKNVRSTPEATEAIGVNLGAALPGMYWLNYLGVPYVRLIGRERVLAAPAAEVTAVGDGVVIALGDDPDDWTTPSYREREENCITHLGPEFFFDKNLPNRRTVAPDLRPDRATPSSTPS